MIKCIRPIKIGPAKRAIIDQANEYIAESGAAVTLREVYYLFIGANTFPDDWIDREYNQEKGLDPTTKNTIKKLQEAGRDLDRWTLRGTGRLGCHGRSRARCRCPAGVREPAPPGAVGDC